MKTRILRPGLLLALLPTAFAALPADYTGRPFSDAYHQTGPARIPGVVQCARFDLGGEGVAYHDTTAANEGSGVLNRQTAPYNHQRAHAGEYVWHFRADEAVDVSYVKDWADLNHDRNAVVPPINQFYLGWTDDGEWVNYTVEVREPGTYMVHALYSQSAAHVTRDTAGRPTAPLRFELNGRPAGEIGPPRATADWHAWDFGRIATVTFPEAGLQLLTFRYRRGNNWAFFVFEKITPP
jgi:hypothetical protein